MKHFYSPALLGIALAAALSSCASSSRDNPDTMLKTEAVDGTGPVVGPNGPIGPGAIGGGSNSGGTGSGGMAGPGMAAGAATYSSGR
jgi:hypothetical protein